MFADVAKRLQNYAASNYTEMGLKALIIAWAVMVIILAAVVKNKWLLAGLLAWEILP